MEMPKISRAACLVFLWGAIFAPGARGQTINAASCNETDVAAALALITTDGTTVVIPPGTCTWIVPLTYTQIHSFTLQGAGSESVIGGGDATVILDHVNHTATNFLMKITTGSAATSFRWTGITIKQDSNSTPTTNGILQIGGNSQSFRFDHSHFVITLTSASICVAVSGWMYGVADHNLFDLPENSVNNGIRISHGGFANDPKGIGNGSWASPTAFGSNQFFFLENNTFNGGFANDCNNGGRQVLRFNTFNSSVVQAHEMESDFRGCRAGEDYLNVYNGNPADNIGSSYAYETRMGPSLVWGNVATNYQAMLDMANDRDNTFHGFGAAPPVTTAAAMTGWGFCGSITNGSNQGPSQWDFSTSTPGYPCIDQVGRGKSDLITGLFNPPNSTKINSVTGSVSWPHNALEPVYEWLDQFTKAPNVSGGLCTVNPVTPTIQQNREYYCYTLTWNGTAFTGTPFNGTVGTGSGPLSARPATCTAGPGGNTPGVAYWATDQGNWNQSGSGGQGQLYVCTATNTWTLYYTPFTYPHPLDSNAPSAVPPSAPNAIPH